MISATHEEYSKVTVGDENWRGLKFPAGKTYGWEGDSTYIRKAPYFDGMKAKPDAVEDIHGARVLAVLGDSVTTDHISPAGSIKLNGPAGKYLTEHGVKAADFNRSRREIPVRFLIALPALVGEVGYTDAFLLFPGHGRSLSSTATSHCS